MNKIIIWCLTVFISASVFAQKTNFSGTWLINEQKSDFAGQPVVTMFKQVRVVQTPDSLFVYGTRINDESNATAKPTSYALNGTTSSTILSNNRTMKALLVWSADGKTLIRNSSYSLPDNPDKEDYKSEEIWSLSEDTKTLILTRTFVRSAGHITVKAVYEKQ